MISRRSPSSIQASSTKRNIYHYILRPWDWHTRQAFRTNRMERQFLPLFGWAAQCSACVLRAPCMYKHSYQLPMAHLSQLDADDILRDDNTFMLLARLATGTKLSPPHLLFCNLRKHSLYQCCLRLPHSQKRAFSRLCLKSKSTAACFTCAWFRKHIIFFAQKARPPSPKHSFPHQYCRQPGTCTGTGVRCSRDFTDCMLQTMNAGQLVALVFMPRTTLTRYVLLLV